MNFGKQSKPRNATGGRSRHRNHRSRSVYLSPATDSTRHHRPPFSSVTSIISLYGRTLRRAKHSLPLRRCSESPRPIKIAHNAKFDAKFIKHILGVDLIGLFDTLLASQLVGAATLKNVTGLETRGQSLPERSCR
jgi:hypothetical protein